MTRRRTTSTSGSAVEKSGKRPPAGSGRTGAVLNNAEEPSGVDLPRDAQPSPAWERLKKKPKQLLHEPGALVVEPHGIWTTCHCWEPWVNGHSYRCPLWKKECGECGFHNGLHKWTCRWWEEHAGATPFDHHKKPIGR